MITEVTKNLLVDMAREAAGNAYAPYSGFKVGCAVLVSDGSFFTGCNVETSSYGITNCAERVAVVKAVSEGHRRFTAMALAAGSEEFYYPCGICREILIEFCTSCRIILVNGSGNIIETDTASLLPGRGKDKPYHRKPAEE